MQKHGLKKKGISLIVLVITIIIIILLAGAIILSMSGENNIITMAKKAKTSQEETMAEETLVTSLASILADNNGNKDLKNLDNLKISDFNVKISNISRLVTLSSGNDAYNFLVDSDYKVTKLTGISGNNQGTNNGGNQGSSSSEIINDFNIKLEEQKGFDIKINIDGEITTTDGSDILGYMIFVDGQGVSLQNKLPYEIKLTQMNKTYKIDVMAMDKNGKGKYASNSLSVTIPNLVIEVLQYPIMSIDGFYNIKYVDVQDSSKFSYGLDLTKDCTASDAIGKNLYDGDPTTYAPGGDRKNTYLLIDESLWGKTLKFNYVYAYHQLSFYNSSGTRLSTDGGVRNSSVTITVPANATKLLLYFNEGGGLYSIDVIN